MKLPSILALACATLAFACGGEDDEPEAAVTLLASIRSQEYAAKYFRPAGYEAKKASTSPHGTEVEVFINDKVQNILKEQIKFPTWPQDSIIALNGYEEGKLTTIAILLKRSDAEGWFWAELDAESGESRSSGKPETCIECHQSGSDYVKSFKLPQ